MKRFACLSIALMAFAIGALPSVQAKASLLRQEISGVANVAIILPCSRTALNCTLGAGRD